LGTLGRAVFEPLSENLRGGAERGEKGSVFIESFWLTWALSGDNSVTESTLLNVKITDVR